MHRFQKPDRPSCQGGIVQQPHFLSTIHKIGKLLNLINHVPHVRPLFPCYDCLLPSLSKVNG